MHFLLQSKGEAPFSIRKIPMWEGVVCAVLRNNLLHREKRHERAPVLLTRSSGKPPRADVRFITPGVRRGCFHLFLRLSRTQPQWRNSRFLNSKRCWIRNSSSSVARQLQRQRGRVRAGRWLGEERRWVDGFLPRAQRQRAEPRYQVFILFFREPGNGAAFR
jgi:hypothetical protein